MFSYLGINSINDSENLSELASNWKLFWKYVIRNKSNIIEIEPSSGRK